MAINGPQGVTGPIGGDPPKPLRLAVVDAIMADLARRLADTLMRKHANIRDFERDRAIVDKIHRQLVEHRQAEIKLETRFWER